jgi:hypothetical protein
MKQKFTALICGYGVPKDILTDQNYTTYLVPCFNTLFDRFRDTAGTIVLSGGHTDLYPPYRRTEAGEMKRWFVRQMKIARQESGATLPWKLALDTKALTSIENVFNSRPYVTKHVEVLICGDKTRMRRLKKFFQTVFPHQPFTFISVDFDMSKNRYRLDHIEKREAIDLEVGLEAIRNPKVFKLRREFARKKIKAMRKLGPKSTDRLPEILERLRHEFAARYKAEAAHTSRK